MLKSEYYKIQYDTIRRNAVRTYNEKYIADYSIILVLKGLMRYCFDAVLLLCCGF